LWASVRWMTSVAMANDRVGGTFGLPTIDRGWKVTATGGIEHYITKMGIGDQGANRAASLEAELTDQGDKTPRGERYSMDELESRYVTYFEDLGPGGETADVLAVIRAYVEGMRGFHAFHVTPKLAERIAALPLLGGLPACLATDPLASEPAGELRQVCDFTTEEWYTVRRIGPYAKATIEEIVEAGGTAEAL